MIHLSLKSFAVIFPVSVAIAECQLQMYSLKNVAIFLAVCRHFEHVHDCLTVQIFPVTGQSIQGKGYLLVGDVSSWRCCCPV